MEPGAPRLGRGEFVEQGYDLRRLIATIVNSRTYQMPAVRRTDDVAAREYVFAGPEVRRLTAEQFADAIGVMTGSGACSRAAAEARRRSRRQARRVAAPDRAPAPTR